MGSSEGQTPGHRERARSLASLWFFAKEKHSNVRVIDKEDSFSSLHTYNRFFYSMNVQVYILLRTCDNCGLFQLTGTKALELEPEEVDEVLLVTAITFGFPFLPAAVC